MSYIRKVAIISSAAICIGAGLYFIPKLGENLDQNTIPVDKNAIYNNIETKTKTKKVQFDTAEEMFAYTDKITTINGIEEATAFITDFLEHASSGQPEVMLTYYTQSLWDTVLENNMFPFYDESGSVIFKASDVTVKEGKSENQYITTYKVLAVDSETKEPLADLKREDTFELYKDFEVIKIVNYTRKTTNEKYY